MRNTVTNFSVQMKQKFLFESMEATAKINGGDFSGNDDDNDDNRRDGDGVCNF